MVLLGFIKRLNHYCKFFPLKLNKVKLYCAAFLWLTIFSLVSGPLFSQENQYLNYAWSQIYNLETPLVVVDDSSEVALQFTSFKPRIVKPIMSPPSQNDVYMKRKFYEESLFIAYDKNDKFRLTIDPLFNLEIGKDLVDTTGETPFTNTRGVRMQGAIGEQFFFYTSFYENQSTFVQYIDDKIAYTGTLFPGTEIVPGQGRAKVFKVNGYDYAQAFGYISYSPSNTINLQLGHGKHFIGHGYRSLFLSDNAHNYPYARISTTYKKLQFTNLYTSFLNLTDGGVTTPANIERLFQKKVGAYQTVSYNHNNIWELGVSQSLIWTAADTMNAQHLSFNTFNPILGVNAFGYGMRNDNNVMLAFHGKYNFQNNISAYGQIVVDDFKRETDLTDVYKKYGYQLGLKYFQQLKFGNLYCQVELNRVRPYTFSAEKVAQSYTHFNQSLAHPLGANFNEIVSFINFKRDRHFAQLKMNFITQGLDSANSNYGSNVFVPDNSTLPVTSNLLDVKTLQGNKSLTNIFDLHYGYLVNPVTNFSVVMGVISRINTIDDVSTSTHYVYFSVRTYLRNLYYDF